MELDTKNQLQRCDGNGERKEHVVYKGKDVKWEQEQNNFITKCDKIYDKRLIIPNTVIRIGNWCSQDFLLFRQY